MKQKIKVSVLVPIYNVEKFLPECLESLTKQTLKDIEIICINDGSTDSSPKIIQQYAEKDSRIVIINKKNSGYGDSMNQGLAIAKGEYIGIVESDDFIEKNSFAALYDMAEKYNLEVVKGNYYEYVTQGRQDIRKSDMFLPKETNCIIDPYFSRHIFYQQPSIWSAIYKRSFLKDNNIDFLPSPGASYQDAGFNFKVFAMARKVLFVNDAFLHYRQDNPNSSVKSNGKIYCVKEEYDNVEKYLKDKKVLSDFGYTLANVRLSSYIWNMKRLNLASAYKFGKVIKKDYINIKQNGYLHKAYGYESWYRKDKTLIIRHPNLYLFVRPIGEAMTKVRSLASMVAQKLLPSYRQRITTINLIKKMEITNDRLEEKIDKLEGIVEEER